jgi:invasion protein IalB
LNSEDISRVGPRRALVRLIAAGTLIAASFAPSVWAQSGGAAPWRVECGGDGKILTCNAIQQVVTQEKQLLAQAVARLGLDKATVLSLQLPLGLNVSEPVLVKIDAGKAEKVPMQTCTNVGCFLSLPLTDPLLGSMRTGQQLKLAVKDTNNRTIDIDLPLLGFGLAFDKATK